MGLRLLRLWFGPYRGAPRHSWLGAGLGGAGGLHEAEQSQCRTEPGWIVDCSQFIRCLLRVCWSTKAEHYECSEAEPADIPLPRRHADLLCSAADSFHLGSGYICALYQGRNRSELIRRRAANGDLASVSGDYRATRARIMLRLLTAALGTNLPLTVELTTGSRRKETYSPHRAPAGRRPNSHAGQRSHRTGRNVSS